MVKRDGTGRFLRGNQINLGRKRSKKERLDIGLSQIGKKSRLWRGGTRKDAKGYILVYTRDHPHRFQKALNGQGYVLEHRLVMEKHLGRYLNPGEVVHHINDISDDNRIENLVLFPNRMAHTNYHRRLNKEREAHHD